MPVNKKTADKAAKSTAKPRASKAAKPKAAAAAKPKAATKASTGKTAKPKAAAKPRAPRAKSVTLSIKAQPGLKVFVAGTFNDWDPNEIALTEKKGVYSVKLSLKPGVYEYKFIVNDVWTLDPNPDCDWTHNNLGTLNNVLRVD